MSDGWVYFVRPIGMSGPIKIGHACDLRNRFSMLEASSPFPLEVVAKVRGGRNLEGRFHALFLEHHSHREWFHHCPAIDKAIDEINAGIFDFEALPAPFLSIAKTIRGAHKAMKPYPGNVVGVAGVRPTKHNTWTAGITVRGIHHHLGTFQTVDAAIAARRAAERDHGLIPSA